MMNKRPKPEEIITKLRQVEVLASMPRRVECFDRLFADGALV